MSPSFFPGFDGLMTLSRREGVDIRPTLLRVLTDLYVQSPLHTADEERQFVELASRLYDDVDDASRAAIRGRLSIYPRTPAALIEKFGLHAGQTVAAAAPVVPAKAEPPDRAAALAMQPRDASEIAGLFWRAKASERALMLHNLATSPLKPALPAPARIAERAVETLEMAAFAQDAENFSRELSDSLIVPLSTAQQIVGDDGGEALACALKALDMPSPAFQRVLLFLDPARGASVDRVYRLARLYDHMGARAALILVSAWRGASLAAPKPRHQTLLHDDERHRARTAATGRRVTRDAAPALQGSRGSQK